MRIIESVWDLEPHLKPFEVRWLERQPTFKRQESYLAWLLQRSGRYDAFALRCEDPVLQKANRLARRQVTVDIEVFHDEIFYVRYEPLGPNRLLLLC